MVGFRISREYSHRHCAIPCRSGKSSIARVVFSKMPPHETLFLVPSTEPRVFTIATNPYMQWAVWDWPGDMEWHRGGPSTIGTLPGSTGAHASSALGSSFMGTSAEGSLPTGISLSNSMMRGGGASRSASSHGRAERDAAALQAPVKLMVFEDPQDETAEGQEDEAPATPTGSALAQTVTQYEALCACSAIIFVIDAADEPYTEAIECLRNLAGALLALAKKKAASAATQRASGPVPTSSGVLSTAATGIPGSTPTNPYALPTLEIFLHKIDGDAFTNAGPETRTELLRDVGVQVAQELTDAGFTVSGLPSVAASMLGAHRAAATGIGGLVGPVPITVSFHLTSIYDHSIFEALSRVVQKVTPGPQLTPSCENLLNALQQSCGAEKVFLFDVVTKLYYATDSSPVQESTYELASEMIEVVVDVGCIYDPVAAAELSRGSGGAEDLPRHVRQAQDAGRCSTSLIKLGNGMAMYMREVAPFLAVVALIRDDETTRVGEDVDAAISAAERAAADDSDLEGAGSAGKTALLPRSGLSLTNRALVDYNILVFARALANLFAVRFGFASGVVTDESGLRVPGKAAPASTPATGSYGGLPLSSSLSKSYGGVGSYMARSMGAPGLASPDMPSPQKR
jgi:hypothetical protein